MRHHIPTAKTMGPRLLRVWIYARTVQHAYLTRATAITTSIKAALLVQALGKVASLIGITVFVTLSEDHITPSIGIADLEIGQLKLMNALTNTRYCKLPTDTHPLRGVY